MNKDISVTIRESASTDSLVDHLNRNATSNLTESASYDSLAGLTSSLQQDNDNLYNEHSNITIDKIESVEHENDKIYQSATREALCIAVVCVAQLLTQSTLAQTIIPGQYIAESFNTHDPGELSWFAAAFGLTAGTFILPSGRLGDMYGHKLMLVIAYITYSIASLLCGLSYYTHNIPFFDICRSLQGIGVAMAVPNAIAVLGVMYPTGKKRNMAFGIYAAVAPLGLLSGASVSAAFAQLYEWQWLFYLPAILVFIASIVAYYVLPDIQHISDVTHRQVFDIYGCITGVIGLVLLNFSLNQAPLVGWNTPYIYALLICGIFFLCVFVYIEQYISIQPLLPFNYITMYVVSILLSVMCGWSSMGIWLYYTIQFLQDIRNNTPLYTVAMMVPMPVTGVSAGLCVGYILHRTHSSNIMLCSLCSFVVGLTLMATNPVKQNYWIQTFISFCLLPIGIDCNFASATILLSNTFSRRNQGLGASLVNTVVNYSVSIGLGIAATVQRYSTINNNDKLIGYRAALYCGVGFSALGAVIATIICIHTKLIHRSNNML